MDYKALVTDALVQIDRLERELKQSHESLEQIRKASVEPIAVVGMGCRYPGGIDSPNSFWQALVEARDCIGDVGKRWNLDKYYDPDPTVPGKICSRYLGMVDDVMMFDPAFFGISPREAKAMDPQQRILLEVMWHALSDAGLSKDAMAGSKTGVYIGIGAQDYSTVQAALGSLGEVTAYDGTGNALSIAAARISYWLNLTGPSMAIDTACSSSLVAVHLAMQSLRSGESEAAIVGGVNVITNPATSVVFSQAQMLAPDGRCKTFDQSADGYVRAEGCGVLVLKKLSDALESNDRIYGVLRGSSVNQDGKSQGLTAPNENAQVNVIRSALDNAQITADKIDYVEAHGTGTALGDPIELSALAEVFKRSDDHPLAVGSVKTNLGHCETAAGVAGIIKGLLALRHGVIPKQINYSQPNAYVPWESNGIYVVDKDRSINSEGCVGVSSFGFGGTNAHVIIQGVGGLNEKARQEETPEDLGPFFFPLSAEDSQALQSRALDLANYMEDEHASSLSDLAYTLQQRNTHLPLRHCVRASTREELASALRKAADSREAKQDSQLIIRGNKTVFLFPGQGAQYLGMGKELYTKLPVFQRVVDASELWLTQEKNYSIKSLLWNEDNSNHILDQTENTQIALFVIEVALAKQWQALGIHPQRLVGHSVGEFSAAYISGMISLEDALALVFARGELMAARSAVGSMLAVSASEQHSNEILERFSGVDLAAVNAPNRRVYAGDPQAIEELEEFCRTRNLSCRQLAGSRAFHSRHMMIAANEFLTLLKATDFHKPSIPIVSTLTGRIVSDEMCQSEYWAKQLQEPVNFNGAIQELVKWQPKILVEVGPGRSLLALVQEIFEANDKTTAHCLSVSSLRRGADEFSNIASGIRSLYGAGLNIQWEGLKDGNESSVVSLPNYPFARELYWFETPELNEDIEHAVSQHEEEHKNKSRDPEKKEGWEPVNTGSSGGYLHPLFKNKTSHPLLTQTIYDVHLSPLDFPELKQHKVMGKMVVAGGFILSLFEQALVDLIGEAKPLNISTLQLIQPVLIELGSYPTVQVMVETDKSTGIRKVWKLTLVELIDGQLREYAKAEAEEFDQDMEPVEALRVENSKDVDTAPLLSGVDFYQKLMETTELIHGPDYQWIHSIQTLNEGVVAELRKPVGLVPSVNKSWHAGLIDSCLQGIAALGLDQLNEPNAPVPMEFSGVRSYGYPSYQEGALLKLSCDLLSFSEQGIEVGLKLYQSTSPKVDLTKGHQTGDKLLLEVKSVEFRYLSKTLFDELVLGRVQTLHYKSVWVQREQNFEVQEINHENSLVRLKVSVDSDTEASPFVEPEVIEAGARVVVDATGFSQDAEAFQGWDAKSAWILIKALQQVLATNPSQVSLLLLDNALADWTHGAVKCLRLERYDVLFQTIVLSDGLEESEKSILNLLLSGEAGEFKLEGDKLHQQQLQSMSDFAQGEIDESMDLSGGVVITGGFGGVGWHFVESLVADGCTDILILHRSPATTAQQQQLELWKQNGLRIENKSVDISDLDELQTILQDHKARFCNLFHCAGSLSDGLLSTLDQEAFDRVTSAKINGLLNLLSVFCCDKLNRVVLFSSQAAQLGNVGQTLYGAANAVIDGVARRLAEDFPNLNINSVAWSPWDRVGMTSSLDDAWYDNLAVAGVKPIEPQRALPLLLEAQSQGSGSSAVMDLNWSAYLSNLPNLQSELFFYQWIVEHVDLQEPDAGRINHELVNALEAMSSEERLDHLLDYMNSQLTQVLDRDHIDIDESVLNLGIDSLMAMEFRAELKRELALEIPLAQILEGASLRGLSEWVNTQLTPDYFQRIKQGIVVDADAEMSLATVNTATLLEAGEIELELDEETITIGGDDITVNIHRQDSDEDEDSDAVLEFEL